MRRTLVIAALLAMLLLSMAAVGCGSSEPTEKGDKSMSSAPSSTPSGGRQLGPDGKPVKTLADFPDGQDGADVEAVLKTAKGDIVLQFYPDKAPVTVASFIHLARTGFYNGVRFHRVEPGFVIQGGDPKSKDPNATDAGTGGPGYYLPAEFNDLPHKDGTLSMARAQHPNSGGSQFYICLGDQAFLDGQYTVFGQTVSGMDVVNSIAIGDVINEVIIRPKSGS